MFRHLETEIMSIELWKNVTLKLSLEGTIFTFTWTVTGLGQRGRNAMSIQCFLSSKPSQNFN